jgi:dATP/dGTP diphosphohydrolase, N-terminal
MSKIITGVGPDAEVETLSTGGKQSKVPARLDKVDPFALINLGEILMGGDERYDNNSPRVDGRVPAGSENWRSIPIWSHLNKALIHIFSYFAGDTQDDHLGHAHCRLHFALAMHLEKQRVTQS